MQTHTHACLETLHFCGCSIFLWKSPLRFFFLTITSRVEKSRLSCFLPAHPPAGKVGEVSVGYLGGSIPVVSHVSKRLLSSGLYGFILPPGTARCSIGVKAVSAQAQGILNARIYLFFNSSGSLVSQGNFLCLWAHTEVPNKVIC